jgi:serine/threonine protein kinase
VFVGSEDFAVYLYEPNFDLKGTTMTFKSGIETSRLRQRVRKIPSTRNGDNFLNMNTLIIVISCVALSVGFVFATIYARKRIQQKHVAELSKENGSSTDTSVTFSDLKTFVNSSMGISKHASYEIAPSSIVPEKELASGGGGVIYLARLMDPKLLSKHGQTVVQKQVFIKNKLSEEAFYQEIGILVMLSKYPHFCQLIGFTTIPFAIILKYYPQGSLSHWIKQNHYGSTVIVKILHEISAGLNSMHSHSLAHCDIKPQNILIEIQNGLPNCFLTDFGITQILSERVVASTMFQIVSLRGLSVHYAAPEAFTNFRSKKFVRVDYRKYDIFSFACLSFELLTRNSPWA